MELRSPNSSDCNALSQLCLRSKAHWGYDPDFIAACRDALTISPDAVKSGDVMTAIDVDGNICGVAQIVSEPDSGILDKLFVEPDAMGKGAGKLLFRWAKDELSRRGAETMTIDADPDAEPFYAAMGAKIVGKAESTVTPGRFLPLMEVSLSA